MGAGSSRVGVYMKLTPDQRALVKQVWSGVEKNPQFHGSVFFRGFCEIYPQYIKYFTTEPGIPLNFDSRTNAKFTVIMETMGYLLLDFHNKPKQLDQVIGYVAMVHKDMNLDRSDMFNFGVSLLEYLSVTFPVIMTPESLEVISKYMNNLLGELSQKIENLKKDEILDKYETLGNRKTSCGDWLLCRDSLIYGQTPSYWRERKNKWDERLNDWKLNATMIIDPIRSSTDEEEVALKSRTEDETSEFAESTARLLESHGIPRKTKITLSPVRTRFPLTALEASSSRRLAKIRRPPYQPKMRNETVQEETASIASIPESVVVPMLTPRERRRNRQNAASKNEAEAATSNIQIHQPGSPRRSISSDEQRELKSSQAPHLDKSGKIDSLARRRRRLSQEKSLRSHSPSVYF